MGKLFGTDGVRGVAGKDLTCELALQIGRGTAAVLTRLDGHRPKILIGKDTRVSGDMLESTLAAGLCSVGADVQLLGVIPTPGVAYLVRKYGADAGIMISASHNPMEFNGIKIFKGDGYKLPDEVENQIEEHVFNNCADIKLADGADIGRITMCRTGVADYVDFLQEHIDADLSGLKVLFDCANGASARVAQELFPRLGCECGFMGTQQDGVSVNDGCGSTHLEALEAAVKAGGYDMGIAFDGDADRCLAVDENGEVIDGDKLIAIFAKHMRDNGKLNRNTAVVTVMTNLGFTNFAKANGINMLTTKVGDRYILEQMLLNDYSLGGEQSGHIIFREFAKTGDGQLTAVQLMNILKLSDTSMSSLAGIMERYPQVMINVKIASKWKENWKNVDEIEQIIDLYQKKLGSTGRILVRESGTEPLVRVMVEGKRFDLINDIAVKIADKIKECCPAD